MKILLVITLAACTVLPLNKVTAPVFNQKEKINAGVKTIYSRCAYTSTAHVFAAAADSVNALRAYYPAVYKNIFSQFKNIKKLRYSIKGQMLFISFINEGRETSTVYKPDGKMNYCVTNLAADLPASAAQILAAEYPSHSIFYSREITVKNKTIYQVIIHNRNEYRVVNIENKEMEEIQVVKKPGLL